MKNRICLSLLGMALLALPLAALQPARSAPVAPAALQAPEGSVLYDQTDNIGANSISSQNFEASFDAYDNAAADDFEVPAGVTWTVTDVYVPGVYFNGFGPLVSVDVNFYADNTGLPGGVECSSTGVIPGDSAGTLTITLPAACVLPEGKHWVSVIANMDFGVGGQWGWTERTVQSFDGSVWQNPGNGFGSGCTTWANRVGCGVGGPDPDLVYSLSGTTAVAAVTQEVPTLGSWGIAALVLLLAVGSLALLARRKTA